jgi:hypothetical protein
MNSHSFVSLEPSTRCANESNVKVPLVCCSRALRASTEKLAGNGTVSGSKLRQTRKASVNQPTLVNALDEWLTTASLSTASRLSDPNTTPSTPGIIPLLSYTRLFQVILDTMSFGRLVVEFLESHILLIDAQWSGEEQPELRTEHACVWVER